jgi:NosR/NirI family nitrous oxide reductase transcriptional regulator
MPHAKVNQDIYESADWLALTGSGAIRRLKLTNDDVDKEFIGTEAEDQASETEAEKAEVFTDIYYTQLDIPTIGKNLLGESEYQWMMEQLKPGEHVIGLMGNGYSFKGSGYVRGGIFDRVIIHQGDLEFSFRDVDQYRINDLFADNVPHFSEMSLFIVRDHYKFNPGQEWQLELLVRRQTGPIEGVFTSFKADYEPIEKYLIIPPPPVVEEELSLWEEVWQERSVETAIVFASILILMVVLFLQDWLVKFPVFMQRFRVAFLIFTVVFIGWVCKGQLSVVNVLTFVQSLVKGFNWEIFLLDPVIFVLWCFVAVTMLLWGRGVYCGWLCPFGALQEILGKIATKLKIPQIKIPYVVHERLWAIKYLILLALFGLSLESLSVAEHYAEVEPFKTTFLLRFDRDWPFILYALGLLLVSLFSHKAYCRYVCPLGAAIAVPSAARLFDWLKRRKECGKPCQICATECEIGAITPTGEINMRECHYCLDCQMTYHDKVKCPPLAKKYRVHTKAAPQAAVNIIAKG